MEKVRYCWLTPELDFSASWDEKEHKEFFNRDRITKLANEKGWRLIKYEVLVGEDFEFPYKAKLTAENATK